MIYKIPYPGLQKSLSHLKIQVLDSVNYCKEFLPDYVNSPDEIFNYCKNRLIYKKDGKNEVFQTAKTIFENNYHGIPGAADCDCMSILLLACFIAKNYKKFGIVLCGRNPNNAVHIYTYCIKDGIKYYLDLTNDSFNFERYYPYKQEIPFKTNPIKIIIK